MEQTPTVTRFEQLHNFSSTVTTTLNKVSNKKLRLCNATATTAIGTKMVMDGQASGIPLALSGMGDLYQILTSRSGTESMQQLVQNAQGNVELLQLIQNGHKESLEIVDTHLKEINTSLSEMEQNIQSIKQLNDESLAELKTSKKQLLAKCDQTIRELKEARVLLQKERENLTNGTTSMRRAKEFLTKVLEKGQNIQKALNNNQTVNKTDAQRIVFFAKQVEKHIGTGETVLRNTETTVQQVLGKLASASKSQTEINSITMKLCDKLGKNYNQAKKAVTNLEQENKKNISRVQMSQKHLKNMQEDIQNMDMVISDLKEQLQQMEEKSRWMISPSELSAASFAAMFTMAWGYGALGVGIAVPAGILVKWSAEKINNYFNSKHAPKLTPSKSKPVVAGFNTASTGIANHFVYGKTGSSTVGAFAVHFPNGTVQRYAFDLNASQRVPTKDMLRLVNDLNGYARKHPSQSEECLLILNEVRGLSVKPDAGKRPVRLFRKVEPAFVYLEKILKRQAELVKRS